MTPHQHRIFLVRLGQTEWSVSGQHTRSTDIPLTAQGIQDAQALSKRFEGHSFAAVLTSPMVRARHTCEIVGLLPQATIDHGLVEWNYGLYEGLTTREIHQTKPHWNLFLNGAPQGESVEEVKKRAQGVIHRLRALDGDIILFSHGHFLTSLAMVWLELSLAEGRHFDLNPSSVSVLTDRRANPVLLLWNDTSHVSILPSA